MTVSVAAVITDVVREMASPWWVSASVSNGRYAQGGIIRDRLIPRIMTGGTGVTLLTDAGTNLDPERVWAG